MMLRVVLLVLVTLALSPAPAQAQRTVVVTLDDLPYAGRSLDDARHVTEALLAALAVRQVPADVFAAGRRAEVDGEAGASSDLLRRWRDAGHALQNHSYGHRRYYEPEVPDYFGDVERGYHVVADQFI